MDEKKILSRLTDDLNIISLLDNEPNDVGGLTAEELKAKFDEAANIIQSYINNTLLPELSGEDGAGNIGIRTISGLTGALDVQKALERIVELMQEMSQGAVADGSITAAKLAPKAVAGENIEDGAVGTEQIAAKAVTGEKIAEKTITAAKLADKIITAAKLADNSVGTEKLADRAVTNAKLGDKCVGSGNMDDLSVPARALQAESVESAKIKDGAVTRAKLAEDVKTLPFENMPVSASAWKADTTYPNWPFRAAIACSGVTVKHSATVIFHPDDAAELGLCSVSNTYNDGVYIYATDVPEKTITIPLIIAEPLS